MILKSASKIVFIIMTLATVSALFTNHISGDQFLVLASMTFAFYFSNKGETTEKFAGK